MLAGGRPAWNHAHEQRAQRATWKHSENSTGHGGTCAPWACSPVHRRWPRDRRPCGPAFCSARSEGGPCSGRRTRCGSRDATSQQTARTAMPASGSSSSSRGQPQTPRLLLLRRQQQKQRQQRWRPASHTQAAAAAAAEAAAAAGGGRPQTPRRRRRQQPSSGGGGGGGGQQRQPTHEVPSYSARVTGNISMSGDAMFLCCGGAGGGGRWCITVGRQLRTLRALPLTRPLAGPACSRRERQKAAPKRCHLNPTAPHHPAHS